MVVQLRKQSLNPLASLPQFSTDMPTIFQILFTCRFKIAVGIVVIAVIKVQIAIPTQSFEGCLSQNKAISKRLQTIISIISKQACFLSSLQISIIQIHRFKFAYCYIHWKGIFGIPVPIKDGGQLLLHCGRGGSGVGRRRVE